MNAGRALVRDRTEMSLGRRTRFMKEGSNDMNRTQYEPAIVTLHWLLAVAVTAMLLIGFVWLRPMPNSDPSKIAVLGLHMTIGNLILALLVLRSSRRKADANVMTQRNPWAAAAHRSIYVILGLLIVTGIATALITKLPAIVWHGSAAQLPARFTIFPTFVAHALLAELLTCLIVVHVFAALFHQFILKDRAFSLMSYRRSRDEGPTAS